jgi:hypothetical protein
MNPNNTPAWESLKKAELWTHEQYNRLRAVLAAEVLPPNADDNVVMHTSLGTVKSCQVTGADGQSKLTAWGPLSALMKAKRVHVLMLECEDTGLSQATLDAINTLKDLRLIVLGNAKAVQKAVAQLNQSTHATNALGMLKSAYVNLFLKDDAPNGPREPNANNVERRVLLASCSPLRPHLSWMANPGGGLSAAVVGQLLKFLQVPDPKQSNNHLVFDPHPSQPELLRKFKRRDGVSHVQ